MKRQIVECSIHTMQCCALSHPLRPVQPGFCVASLYSAALILVITAPCSIGDAIGKTGSLLPGRTARAARIRRLYSAGVSMSVPSFQMPLSCLLFMVHEYEWKRIMSESLNPLCLLLWRFVPGQDMITINSARLLVDSRHARTQHHQRERAMNGQRASGEQETWEKARLQKDCGDLKVRLASACSRGLFQTSEQISILHSPFCRTDPVVGAGNERTCPLFALTAKPSSLPHLVGTRDRSDRARSVASVPMPLRKCRRGYNSPPARLSPLYGYESSHS